MASERENPMPQILIDVLTEYKEKRMIEEKELGRSLTNPEDLVFGTSKVILRSYSGTRSMFDKFLKKHNMKCKKCRNAI